MYDLFVAAGADVVGGFVYLNREHVGTWVNGEFVLTSAGREAAAVTLSSSNLTAGGRALKPAASEPDAVEVAPAPKPHKASKAPKVEAAPAPVEPAAVDTGSLLAGLDDMVP
jgi:hypothetical protein